MSVIDKIIFKKLFKEENYGRIRTMISWDKELARFLSSKEIDTLILKDNSNGTFLLLLLGVANGKQRSEIISKYAMNRRHFTHTKYYMAYFKEFFECAKKNDKSELLLKLGYLADKNYPDYAKQLKEIEDYFFNREIDDLFVGVLYFENIDKKRLLRKLMNSNSSFKITYITGLGVESFKAFLFHNIDYLTEEDFINLVNVYKNNPKYYDILIYCVKNGSNAKVKPLYLYHLYQNDIENVKKAELIDDIMRLKDYEIIEKLMGKLDEEEQNNVIKKYIDLKMQDIVLVLAYSTDCVETYKAIDYIINYGSLGEVLFLVINLEGRFFGYMLDQIIKNKGIEYFTNMINSLAQYDYQKCIDCINFVYIYKLDKIIDVKTLNEWNKYREEKSDLSYQLT